MGDTNQRLFLERAALKVEGPILEIGSKDYGSTEDFRALFPATPFVGIDLASGKGVDHIVDLTLPPPTDILPPASFGLVICCSVLEHVKKPWVMAEYMSSLVKKGGYVFISVPWVWRYHAYPDDYFRFSPNGVKVLFPEISFADMAYSTTVTDEFLDLEDGINGVDDAKCQYQRDGKDLRKFLPYLMVNMVGQKV